MEDYSDSDESINESNNTFSEDDEEEEIITNDIIEDNVSTVIPSIKKNKYNNGFYEFDGDELETIKINNLKKPGRFEIIQILLRLTELYKSGSYSLVDENKIGIKIYDNYNIVNEETMAFISLYERKTGIYTLKENQIINTDDYELKHLLFILKNILRVYGNNNHIIRIETIKNIYPELKIYEDDLF